MNGTDDVRALVDATPAWGPEAEPLHPLARFLELDGVLHPPSWLVPGFISDEVLILAGGHGVGKTTCTVPLALTVAGLHASGDPLAPRHWRHVVYVTEDATQVQRVLAGLVDHAGLGIRWHDVRERFHLVAAARMTPDEFVKVGATYRAGLARAVDGIELLPLVVVDTRSAALDLTDENDNAEAARAVATLRQRFEGLPLWIVAHVSKAGVSRTDAAELSARSASAWEADAAATAFLVRERDDARYLVLGKRRFEPRWPELRIRTGTATVQTVDRFGEPEALALRWGIPEPAMQSRDAARAEVAEREERAAAASLRGDILDAVDRAWSAGLPLSRSQAAAKGGRQKAAALEAIRTLLAEDWLVEVQVPPKQRANSARSAFLVRLQDDERRALHAGKGLPERAKAIPPSWCKPVPPVVPDAGTSGPGGAVSSAPDEGPGEPIPPVPVPLVPLRKTDREPAGMGLGAPHPAGWVSAGSGNHGNQPELAGTSAGAQGASGE